ncbi:MAG: SulP family inorganic anion transporter [Myxococcales bacterium]|nr:SulP family inorganic anion transporter [Myxococcales bacterium]
MGTAGASTWRASLRVDLVAALTVTLVGLPQCLAYALMAGLPPAYGLSTAAVAGLVAALVGKSPHVVTGPTNTTGLLILAAMTPFLGPSGLVEADGLAALATLTLMVGLVRLALGLLGGDKLLRYLPESVLAGFTAGAGVLIGVMQLDEALGMTPFRGGGLWSQATAFATHFAAGDLPRLPAVAITVATVASIAVGRRLAPRLPMALLSVVAGAIFARVVEGYGLGLLLVKDRASVPSGWPPGALPSLDPALWAQFALPSLALVLLGTLELTVSARVEGARPDMRREIFAQGWANVAGAFASAFPASASLTRSVLLRLGGARTRVAAAVSAVAAAPILLFGAEAVGYIPQASLAGVLLITAASMLNRGRMARIWLASRGSRGLLLVTFVATLTLPLEAAILVGCGLGLLIHLGVSADPNLNWLRVEGDVLSPLGPGEPAEVAVLEVSGTLYYAAVPAFFEHLQQTLPPGVRRVVVDLSHAHELRFSALDGLERTQKILSARGATLGLAGVSEDFAAQLRRARCTIPFEPASRVPLASARAMLARPTGAPEASDPPGPPPG